LISLLISPQLTYCRKPVVSPFAPKFVIEQNELFQLTCSIVQGSKPISFQWFKDGSKLATGSDYSIDTKPVSSVLSFEAIKTKNSGNFTCQISNSEGRSQTSTFISVQGLSLDSLQDSQDSNGGFF